MKKFALMVLSLVLLSCGGAKNGDAFVGTEGIRLYFERFFLGYKTASKLLSLEQLDDFSASARLDFTGEFGHEIGTLKITINSEGLIERIDADLE